MKYIKYTIFSVCVLMACAISPVLGKQGEVKDSRVWYTYWDEPSTNVIYTGVVNYLDYQIYAPCVHQLEWGCGGFAMQNDYKEYGEASFMNNHKHGLMNKDRGYDYVVE